MLAFRRAHTPISGISWFCGLRLPGHLFKSSTTSFSTPKEITSILFLLLLFSYVLFIFPSVLCRDLSKQHHLQHILGAYSPSKISHNLWPQLQSPSKIVPATDKDECLPCHTAFLSLFHHSYPAVVLATELRSVHITWNTCPWA